MTPRPFCRDEAGGRDSSEEVRGASGDGERTGEVGRAQWEIWGGGTFGGVGAFGRGGVWRDVSHRFRGNVQDPICSGTPCFHRSARRETPLDPSTELPPSGWTELNPQRFGLILPTSSGEAPYPQQLLLKPPHGDA